MTTISLVLKISAAVATLAGILSFALSWFRVEIKQIPPRDLGLAGFVLVLLAVIVALLDYINTFTPSTSHGSSKPQEDLGGDKLKFVIYYIVFTKRDLEYIFSECGEIIHDATTGDAFKSTKVAEFFQNLANISIPQKWLSKAYPRQSFSGDMIAYLPEEDTKYVQCIYHVEGRLPKDKAVHEERQIDVL
jgi:hypothetical protein